MDKSVFYSEEGKPLTREAWAAALKDSASPAVKLFELNGETIAVYSRNTGLDHGGSPPRTVHVVVQGNPANAKHAPLLGCVAFAPVDAGSAVAAAVQDIKDAGGKVVT